MRPSTPPGRPSPDGPETTPGTPGGALQLSVVIPAYQEAGRLPATVDRIVAHLGGSPAWLPAEVVVVDDGSRDGTARCVEATAPPGVEIHILRHPVNRGKGAAVRTGLAASRGRWVLISDADLASPIEELDTLAGVSAPHRVVVGSRAVDRSLIQQRQPWYRDLMGRTFNLLVRLLAGEPVHDTQCGFKLFPGPLARELAAVQRLDGFAFDVELLARSRRLGWEIVEVGVRWSHVEASRVAPVRHSLQMFRDLVRIAAWRATGELGRRGEPRE